MANLMRKCLLLLCLQLLSYGELRSRGGVVAQLTIDATTPYSSTDGTANTIIGVAGNSVVSSLLQSGTNALLWGYVTQNDVNAVCDEIVDYGDNAVTVTVNHNWGDGGESLTFQVVATGGCLAATDASGTEIVSVDNYGHSNAIVCSENTDDTTCAVWVTGSDVDLIISNSYEDLVSSSLDDSQAGCIGGGSVGGHVGYIAGQKVGDVLCAPDSEVVPVLTSLPLSLCTGGVIAVSVVIGGFIGCAVGFIIEVSCFPGDALVQIEGGQFLPIMDLQVGHKVAVWEPGPFKSQTALTYDEVYAFGHKEEFARSTFYKISMRPDVLYESESAVALDSHHSIRTLEISAQHFLPAIQYSGIHGKHEVVHKRAKDVKVGDHLWATADLNDERNNSFAILQPHVVTAISLVYKKGLYNPLTLTGSIVVNGVVASVHSEWFLDDVFEKFGLPSSLLPYAYQTALAPARILYRIWPREFYIAMYNWLDMRLNVAESYAPVTAVTSILVVALLRGGFLYTFPSFSHRRLSVSATASRCPVETKIHTWPPYPPIKRHSFDDGRLEYSLSRKKITK